MFGLVVTVVVLGGGGGGGDAVESDGEEMRDYTYTADYIYIPHVQ